MELTGNEASHNIGQLHVAKRLYVLGILLNGFNCTICFSTFFLFANFSVGGRLCWLSSVLDNRLNLYAVSLKTTAMPATAIDVTVAWSVRSSVCLSVILTQPDKAVGLNEMPGTLAFPEKPQSSHEKIDRNPPVIICIANCGQTVLDSGMVRNSAKPHPKVSSPTTKITAPLS